MAKCSEERKMDRYEKLFLDMHPGFFEQDYVRRVPENEPASEMLLSLKDFDDGCYTKALGENVSFGSYDGSIEELKKDVAKVVPHWTEFFTKNSRVFCGFVEGRVASFCIIEDFGRHMLDGKEQHIGGPGCVGTLPEFRDRGIGLSMVREATKILKNEAYDLSYIHYTYETAWYAKLGYKTIVRWSGKGFGIVEGGR